MNDTKKRTRAPKQLPLAEILNHVYQLSLSDKVTLLVDLKDKIETEKKAMQEKIELINSHVK